MFAKIVIEYPVKSLDKSFTYKIPEHLKIMVGMKVYVPFGNQNVQGFVLEITDVVPDNLELKEIYSIIDNELILTPELMKLGYYMKEMTLCPLITAYQTMLPTAFKINNKNSDYNFYKTYIVLNKSKLEINEFINTHQRNKRQIEILDAIEINGKIDKKLINGSSLKNLLDNGFVREEKEQLYRINETSKEVKKVVLTEDQNNAYETIKNCHNYETFLIYGVTGSGKTEVYLNIIEDVYKNGKTAIMLVPEISLTMQIVKRFYERFGDEVAVLHSALSEGEKHDEYLKIMRGDVKIVVGTRSGIFAPLKNLGVIIVDEEHSDTYKQDNMPRYNAIDMARFRAKYHNIPLVLGSATPSLEAMARAKKGIFKLINLPNRVGKSVLPNITLVNMEAEYKKKNFIFSELLINKIKECITRDEQVILLLNRRGFSTFITCSNCGYTYKCPNCDITLTYHKSSDNLVCHYCGYQHHKDLKCPNCNEDGLHYMGLGTEKLEEEICRLFSEAKVVRMDQDSTSRKGSHEKIIESFKNHEYNILLGTSMISKGLDFPDVTLVGVINADVSLNLPGYRSNENTFELLNQVAGRAGRRDKVGEVIIQTFNPDNDVLKCVKDNSYEEFYNYEMSFRHKLMYPPYYFLVGIKIVSKDYNLALDEAKKVVQYLRNNLEKKTIVLGPTTASILRFNNYYRFQIIIKYQFDNSLKKTLKDVDNLVNSKKDLGIEIDFNPIHI